MLRISVGVTDDAADLDAEAAALEEALGAGPLSTGPRTGGGLGASTVVGATTPGALAALSGAAVC